MIRAGIQFSPTAYQSNQNLSKTIVCGLLRRRFYVGARNQAILAGKIVLPLKSKIRENSNEDYDRPDPEKQNESSDPYEDFEKDKINDQQQEEYEDKGNRLLKMYFVKLMFLVNDFT
jgi:hypothetical protein